MTSHQPFTLPPAYILDFVRSVFPEDLCMVDFTQALTALDYLAALESRRRNAMIAALQRLGVEVATLDQQREQLKQERPGIAEWVGGVVAKAKRIESLYTQVYIGLRRWTLINEMRLEPFNKPNCIAMLNTLYPATYAQTSHSQLTPMLLNSQRNAFFRYILAVESNGKDVLSKLEQQGKRVNDVNAWPIVRDIVEKYLRTANNLIQDCMSVKGPEDVEHGGHSLEKRTDSGISLDSRKSSTSHDAGNSSGRPVTSQSHYLELPRSRSGSSTSSYHGQSASSDREPMLASIFCQGSDSRNKEVRKIGSTLERLTREIKRMRSRSNEGRDEFEGSAPPSRPDSRSRGYSGSSGQEWDPFTVDKAPVPMPTTATTMRFPDGVRDASDNHIMPLPSTSSRPYGLKKMKSAGHLGFRERESCAVSVLKHGLSLERKSTTSGNSNSGSGSTLFLHNTSGYGRSYSVATGMSAQPFNISDEERSRMIARAKAEKEAAAAAVPTNVERKSYSPIRTRTDTVTSTSSSSSNSSGDGSASGLGVLGLPMSGGVSSRRNSPGRNKLRDYFGVQALVVPTSFPR